MKIKPILYFFIGISGSGKSFYLDNKFLEDFPLVKKYLEENKLTIGDIIISPDNLRRELTGDVNNHEHEAQIWMGIMPSKIKKTLDSHGHAILDATNVSKRNSFLKKFRKYDIVAIIFKPNLELSIERVCNDIENKKDRSNVPKKAIENQYNKFVASVVYTKWDGIWNKPLKKKIKERLIKEEKYTDVIFVK